ncbi:MAG: hypothetical protein AAGF75_04125 [Cyanobacteria bacterium P01_H01_bin.130]
MSISKRFRAGCLGLALSALGTTPAIAQPHATTAAPSLHIAQAVEGDAANEPASAGDSAPAATEGAPGPNSLISVTTGDVVLLDAGQGPKAPLRLSPEVGNQLQLGADLTMKVTMEMDGQAVPNPGFPSVAMVLGMEVVDVNESGEITYNITYDSIELGTAADFPEQARTMIDEVFQELKSLKLVLVGDNRGRVLNATVEAPDDLNPFLVQMLDSLSQSMKQVSAPLPEEAIGVGARWSITGSVTASGLTLEQTATYELVEREGDRFTVNMDVEQTAEPQTIGASSAIAIELTDYSATGNGNLVMDVGYPLPIGGLINLISTTELSPAQLDQNITSRAEVRMELAPVTSPAP